MVINPVVKTLSDDVDVAGIHNNHVAKDGRILNQAELAFLYVRGFPFLGMGGSAKYFSSSFPSVIDSCVSFCGQSSLLKAVNFCFFMKGATESPMLVSLLPLLVIVSLNLLNSSI